MQTQSLNQLPTHFTYQPSERKFPPVSWSREMLSCVLKPERFRERFDHQNPPLPPRLHPLALELLCSSCHSSRVWVALHSQPSQPHPAAVLRKHSHSDIISGLLQGKWTKWNFISCLINTEFASSFFASYGCVGLVHPTAPAGNEPKCQLATGTSSAQSNSQLFQSKAQDLGVAVTNESFLVSAPATEPDTNPPSLRKTSANQKPEGQQEKLYLQFDKEKPQLSCSPNQFDTVLLFKNIFMVTLLW